MLNQISKLFATGITIMIMQLKNVALRAIRLVTQDDPDIDAVVTHHSAHIATLIRLLNAALANELVGVLRYRYHHFLARSIHLPDAARQFITHANDGLHHTDLLAEHIVRLGGTPNFSPAELKQFSRAEDFSADSLTGMVREDMLAVGRLIDGYRSMLVYLAAQDPVTSRTLEDILITEEAHADALSALLMTHSCALADARNAVTGITRQRDHSELSSHA